MNHQKTHTVRKHIESYGYYSIDPNGDTVDCDYPMTPKQADAVAKRWGGYVIKI